MASNTGWRNSPDRGQSLSDYLLAPSSTAESAIIREVVPGNDTVILKAQATVSGSVWLRSTTLIPSSWQRLFDSDGLPLDFCGASELPLAQSCW